jgi:molybdopterin-guanine dinucleotide biosynthesis protein A
VKIKSIAKNQTELTFALYHGQMTVFFSYKTPVAYVYDRSYAKKTEKWYSTTTTRHINAFFDRHGFDGKAVDTIPQKQLDNIIENTQKVQLETI